MLGWQTAGGEGLSCSGEGLGCGGEGLRGSGEGMDEGDGEGVKAETRYVSTLVLPLAFPRHLLEAICCVGTIEEVACDRAGEA